MTVSGVPPAAIAAAAEEARAFLRLEEETEAALLARLAATAIALGEAFTGTLFVARGVTETLPTAQGTWQLLAATPVRAIDGVAGVTADAYAIDVDGEGRGWVRFVTGGGAPARVTVSYTAGLAGDWTALPMPVAQGVVALIARLFADRGGGQPPAAVAALWRPYRRMRLTMEARQ